MKTSFFFLIGFVPLLGSCDRPAIEPSQSLVGAKELPSSRELSEEIIQINRSFGSYTVTHLLSYELRPNNDLVVMQYERGMDAESVRASETLHLSANVAGQARQALWRMRPDKLEGIESDTLPLKCERKLHDESEVAILFIREGQKAGVEDDQLGFFVLPVPQSCDNENARLARVLLKQVLQSFPFSKVATSFRHMELKN